MMSAVRLRNGRFRHAMLMPNSANGKISAKTAEYWLIVSITASVTDSQSGDKPV